MFYRPKARLAAAAVAAGTVCALAAAGAASAAPAPQWSKTAPAIPHVFTNEAPGLAAFYLNGVRGTFVTWKGQLNNHVMYRYKVNGKWSKVESVPGAETTAGPAAAFYTDQNSKPAELVAWKALKSTTIWYATGEINASGTLSWSKTRSIAVKGDKLAYSDSGPAVLFPLQSPNARVIIAWRGPGHHVRYELGSPNGRYFTFDKSQWISGGTTLDKTTTSGTPALTEVLGTGGNGTIYVFWKADGNGKAISYASTPDPTSGLTGNKTVPWTLLGGVKGADSTSPPTATSVDEHGYGPLLLAYKGPSGNFIRYQELTASGWSAYKFVTGPNSKTTISPSLLNRTLANVSPTSSGTIYLRSYLGS